jgi:hypothetical protein
MITDEQAILSDWLLEQGFIPPTGATPQDFLQLWYPDSEAWRHYKPTILVAHREVHAGRRNQIVITLDLHYPKMYSESSFDVSDFSGIQEAVLSGLEQYDHRLLQLTPRGSIHARDIGLFSNGGVRFPLCKTNPPRTQDNPNGYLDMDWTRLRTSGDVADVTCKACLKKLARDYPWAMRRGRP